MSGYLRKVCRRGLPRLKDLARDLKMSPTYTSSQEKAQQRVRKSTRATVSHGGELSPESDRTSSSAGSPLNFRSGMRKDREENTFFNSGKKFRESRRSAPEKFNNLLLVGKSSSGTGTNLANKKFREGNFGWKICCWRKRRGSIFWGNQKKSLTVSDPPFALPVNPLKVSDRFLGGFHTPVAP
ncbi:hypothetical protein HNY73_005204 [Argiope bruennichi]|uniref:Uncharacterized protein n=1 Tax=Argiope bruennichi TaxID=94029 RepID=A0A8T0FFQ5_ARGBR|nr:hypothetical protein HNY73_005204 [Argiope bruennichi]